MSIQAIDNWHKTRLGHLMFGLVELGLAYVFISLAIDTGSLWYYAVTFIFTVGLLQNFGRMVFYKK